MGKNSITVVRCPQCGQPVPWTKDSIWRPFCSHRCQMIDLGEWLSDEEEDQKSGR